MKTNKRLNSINDRRLLLSVAAASTAPPAPTPSSSKRVGYKSVTGPFKLIVLVPLLVVMTFGVTFVMVVEIRCLSSDSVILLCVMLLLLPVLLLVLLILLFILVLFNRITDGTVGPVVIVTTLLLSNCGCDRFCSDFKRCSKLLRE